MDVSKDGPPKDLSLLTNDPTSIPFDFGIAKKFDYLDPGLCRETESSPCNYFITIANQGFNEVRMIFNIEDDRNRALRIGSLSNMIFSKKGYEAERIKIDYLTTLDLELTLISMRPGLNFSLVLSDSPVKFPDQEFDIVRLQGNPEHLFLSNEVFKQIMFDYSSIYLKVIKLVDDEVPFLYNLKHHIPMRPIQTILGFSYMGLVMQNEEENELELFFPKQVKEIDGAIKFTPQQDINRVTVDLQICNEQSVCSSSLSITSSQDLETAIRFTHEEKNKANSNERFTFVTESQKIKYKFKVLMPLKDSDGGAPLIGSYGVASWSNQENLTITLNQARVIRSDIGNQDIVIIKTERPKGIGVFNIVEVIVAFRSCDINIQVSNCSLTNDSKKEFIEDSTCIVHTKVAQSPKYGILERSFSFYFLSHTDGKEYYVRYKTETLCLVMISNKPRKEIKSEPSQSLIPLHSKHLIWVEGDSTEFTVRYVGTMSGEVIQKTLFNSERVHLSTTNCRGEKIQEITVEMKLPSLENQELCLHGERLSSQTPELIIIDTFKQRENPIFFNSFQKIHIRKDQIKIYNMLLQPTIRNTLLFINVQFGTLIINLYRIYNQEWNLQKVYYVEQGPQTIQFDDDIMMVLCGMRNFTTNCSVKLEFKNSNLKFIDYFEETTFTVGIFEEDSIAIISEETYKFVFSKDLELGLNLWISNYAIQHALNGFFIEIISEQSIEVIAKLSKQDRDLLDVEYKSTEKNHHFINIPSLEFPAEYNSSSNIRISPISWHNKDVRITIRVTSMIHFLALNPKDPYQDFTVAEILGEVTNLVLLETYLAKITTLYLWTENKAHFCYKAYRYEIQSRSIKEIISSGCNDYLYSLKYEFSDPQESSIFFEINKAEEDSDVYFLASPINLITVQSGDLVTIPEDDRDRTVLRFNTGFNHDNITVFGADIDTLSQYPLNCFKLYMHQKPNFLESIFSSSNKAIPQEQRTVDLNGYLGAEGFCRMENAKVLGVLNSSIELGKYLCPMINIRNPINFCVSIRDTFHINFVREFAMRNCYRDVNITQTNIFTKATISQRFSVEYSPNENVIPFDITNTYFNVSKTCVSMELVCKKKHSFTLAEDEFYEFPKIVEYGFFLFISNSPFVGIRCSFWSSNGAALPKIVLTEYNYKGTKTIRPNLTDPTKVEFTLDSSDQTHRNMKYLLDWDDGVEKGLLRLTCYNQDFILQSTTNNVYEANSGNFGIVLRDPKVNKAKLEIIGVVHNHTQRGNTIILTFESNTCNIIADYSYTKENEIDIREYFGFKDKRGPGIQITKQGGIQYKITHPPLAPTYQLLVDKRTITGIKTTAYLKREDNSFCNGLELDPLVSKTYEAGNETYFGWLDLRTMFQPLELNFLVQTSLSKKSNSIRYIFWVMLELTHENKSTEKYILLWNEIDIPSINAQRVYTILSIIMFIIGLFLIGFYMYLKRGVNRLRVLEQDEGNQIPFPRIEMTAPN